METKHPYNSQSKYLLDLIESNPVIYSQLGERFFNMSDEFLDYVSSQSEECTRKRTALFFLLCFVSLSYIIKSTGHHSDKSISRIYDQFGLGQLDCISWQEEQPILKFTRSYLLHLHPELEKNKNRDSELEEMGMREIRGFISFFNELKDTAAITDQGVSSRNLRSVPLLTEV